VSVLVSEEREAGRISASDELPTVEVGKSRKLVAVVLFALSVIVIPGGLVLLSVHNQTMLSQFDEPQHVDYLDRISHFELPRFGDRLGSLAMREAACRSIDWPGVQLPPCVAGAAYHPAEFPALGYQYQAHQPPLYYVVTAPIAKAVRLATDVDYVTSARLVGVLWLASALAVLWLAMSEVGATPLTRAGICLLLGVSPAAIDLSAKVTNDAPVLLIGALLALMCVRARRWDSVTTGQIVATASLGLAAAWVKPMNGYAVAAAAIFMTYAAVRQGRASWRVRQRKALVPPIVLLGSCFVAIAVWTAIYRLAAYESYDRIYDVVEGFLKVKHLTIGEISAGLPTLFNATLDVPLGSWPAIEPWASIARYLVLSFGVGFLWRRRDLWSILGSISLGVLLVGGPVLAVITYMQFHVANHLPARYGLAVYALLAIAGAGLPRSRITTALLWTVAIPLVIATYSVVG
jgi:hypothetical protein